MKKLIDRRNIPYNKKSSHDNAESRQLGKFLPNAIATLAYDKYNIHELT